MPDKTSNILLCFIAIDFFFIKHGHGIEVQRMSFLISECILNKSDRHERIILSSKQCSSQLYTNFLSSNNVYYLLYSKIDAYLWIVGT